MRGIAERRRRMVCRVETELVPIPGWARRRNVRGLTQGETFVWLHPGDARALERLDREAGGNPKVLEVEFRLCKVCRRPLLGEEATSRRIFERAGATTYMAPCGDSCIEASHDHRWRRTA